MSAASCCRRALSTLPSNCGPTSTAMMPMITSTTMISSKLKPFCSVFISVILSYKSVLRRINFQKLANQIAQTKYRQHHRHDDDQHHPSHDHDNQRLENTHRGAQYH